MTKYKRVGYVPIKKGRKTPFGKHDREYWIYRSKPKVNSNYTIAVLYVEIKP